MSFDQFEHIADCETPISPECVQKLRDSFEHAIKHMSMNDYYHIAYELSKFDKMK